MVALEGLVSEIEKVCQFQGTGMVALEVCVLRKASRWGLIQVHSQSTISMSFAGGGDPREGSLHEPSKIATIGRRLSR